MAPESPLQEPSLPAAASAPAPESFPYLEVIDSCGPHFEGACLNARSGPGSSFASVMKLRTGMVLATATTTVIDASGRTWHKVVFNEWVRYPERVEGDWYVESGYVRSFEDPGTQEYELPVQDLLAQAKQGFGLDSEEKRIVVDRSDQKLYAYEGKELFLEASVSTGLDLTPTPRGTFRVFKKTPSRYMQGPLPGISDQYYDLPGVPWNLYFTEEGGAIHGAYWHAEFGEQWSHGCVNLPPETAKALYAWTPLGTEVLVRD